MPSESINSIDFQRAIQVQGLLAAVGQRGQPLPDLLLAATSERLSLTLIHHVRYVDLIARITNQRTMGRPQGINHLGSQALFSLTMTIRLSC